MRARPWLLVAVPAILSIWLVLALANYWVGLSYGSGETVLTLPFCSFQLTTSVAFGMMNLAAHVLGTISLFAIRSAFARHDWVAMVGAALVGATAIVWSSHSAVAVRRTRHAGTDSL